MTNPMYGLLPDYNPPQMNIPTHPRPMPVTISSEVSIKKDNPTVHVDEEDPRHANFMPNSQGEPQLIPLTNPTNERLHALEEKFQAMKVHESIYLDAIDMCLLPDLVIPWKFKVPNFEKYPCPSCPKCHLVMLCQKMASSTHDDRPMIHYFHERSSIQLWRNLACAFLKWY